MRFFYNPGKGYRFFPCQIILISQTIRVQNILQGRHAVTMHTSAMNALVAGS